MQKKKEKRNSRKERPVKSRELLESLIGATLGEKTVSLIKGENRYAAVLKISGTDIFHFTDSDKRGVFDRFSKAVRSLDIPSKYIFTTSRPSLADQKEYIRYKLERAKNEGCRELLSRQDRWLSYIEENQQDRVAYLLMFASSEEKLSRSVREYIFSMSDTELHQCVGEELRAAIKQILCFSLPFETEELIPRTINFRQNYFVIGGRYFTDLVVYSYPAYFKDLQLAALFASFGPEVTVTLDCSMQSDEITKAQIDRAISELKGRRSLPQTDAEVIESESDITDLQQLYAEISRGNERMVSTTLRLFISANSESQLSDNCDRVMKEIKSLGMKAFLPEYRMSDEYRFLMYPSDISQNAIPLEDTFKKQFPFYYQSLIDNGGTYFGETVTGGQVLFNPFLQTRDRISYDILISGVKGSGKTITLKSMIADQISVGNKVMLFDIEGEYHTLAKRLGGVVITLGRSSAINPLQLRSAVATNDKDADESNFISEISRIEMFFKQFSPQITPFELEALTDSLIDTYAAFGITSETDVSALRGSDFPLLSDLLDTVQSYLAVKGLSENKRRLLEKVELILKPLAVGAYSSMFNGYSSFDYTSSDLVVFDVKSLSELSERVINAQLSNILSIMWSEICRNMDYNNSLSSPYDRRAVVAVIDEASRYIDSENVMAYMVKLLRRSRKYDAGLWFASQAMSDFKIDCSVLFGLVQYKMLLKQSADASELLERIFPQFTSSEISSLENFVPGEMLLSLGGGRQKLHLKKVVPREDLLWYGNSRDRERLIGLEGKKDEKQQ